MAIMFLLEAVGIEEEPGVCSFCGGMGSWVIECRNQLTGTRSRRPACTACSLILSPSSSILLCRRAWELNRGFRSLEAATGFINGSYSHRPGLFEPCLCPVCNSWHIVNNEGGRIWLT